MKPKRIHYLLTILLVIQPFVVSWLSGHPFLVEQYYSLEIYIVVSSFLRILLGWIPFSFGDVLLFTLIFIALRFLYLTIRTLRRTWLLRIFQLTSFISIIYFCFYFFWGLNYFREPLAKNLGYETKKYTTEELKQLNLLLVQKANQIHFSITNDSTKIVEVPYDQNKIYELAVDAYGELEKKFPQFEYNHPSVKSSLMSLIQSYNGTSGYLNPLTGEAHVNDRIPLTGYPTTTCHEISHQIGYAAENEANFIGFLAASHSTDQYFTYSSYRMALRYSIFELYKRDKELYKEVISKVNPGILKDYNQSSEFWKQFENPFEPLMKKGYNVYLKANNQQKGVESYNYVVDLLISYFAATE